MTRKPSAHLTNIFHTQLPKRVSMAQGRDLVGCRRRAVAKTRLASTMCLRPCRHSTKKGSFRHQAINLAPPERVRAWGMVPWGSKIGSFSAGRCGYWSPRKLRHAVMTDRDPHFTTDHQPIAYPTQLLRRRKQGSSDLHHTTMTLTELGGWLERPDRINQLVISSLRKNWGWDSNTSNNQTLWISSSCTDLLDPLSPPLSITHRSR